LLCAQQPRRGIKARHRSRDIAEHLVHALRIGRAASAAIWARRSFDTATICMALVIFCVALVAAMRTRMS